MRTVLQLSLMLSLIFITVQSQNINQRVLPENFVDEFTIVSDQANVMFSGGSGTTNDPFLIANANDLNSIRLYLNSSFRQVSDINLGVPPWNEGVGWQPIGDLNSPFQGIYDGDRYIISNLFINQPNKTYVGLLGYTQGATIKNLSIEQANITGWRFIGGLAGYISHETVIEYVLIKDIVINLTQRHAGGLIGFVDHSVVYRCSSTGNINRGDYDDWNSVGGLIGTVGSYNPPVSSYIEECYSEVVVDSKTHNTYGGFVGVLESHGEIKNCYARGSVKGTNAIAGGFVGDEVYDYHPRKILNCFSVGSVSAPGIYVSGFLGRSAGGTFNGNFWDIQASGHSGWDTGALGRTTLQMKTMSTFIYAGWNFDEVWDIDPEQIINDGYPYLRWQLMTTQCQRPNNLAITEKTATSASFHWSHGSDESEWEILWGENGFDPHNQGTLIENILDTTYTLIELNNGVIYDVYIRSVCDDNNKSEWAGPNTFKTLTLFNVIGGGSYCEGSGITGLDVILDGSEMGFSYQLYRNGALFGAPAIGTGSMIIWSNMIPGEYDVNVWTEYGAVWMVGSSTVVSNPLPEVSFTLDRDTICLSAFPFVISGGQPNGGSYSGNGVVMNVFFPELAEIGTHLLYYTYYDEYDCFNTDSVEVVIDECSGIPSQEKFKLVEIFPNPAGDQLWISFQDPSMRIKTVRIYNVLGELVIELRELSFTNPFLVDLIRLPKGYYNLKLGFDDETLHKPFIKY